MGVITGIVPATDRPDHVVILVDGVPFATVPTSMVDRLGFTQGKPVPTADEPLDATTRNTRDRALKILARRAYSVHELRQRLLDKGEPANSIEQVIPWLLHRGLLDDTTVAEQRARTGLITKGHSPRRIHYDLVRQGIDPTVAEAAIAHVLADEGADEIAIAERAARKKLRTLSRLPRAEQHRKLQAFLLRQGHSPDAIRQALSRLFETRSTHPSDDGSG